MNGVYDSLRVFFVDCKKKLTELYIDTKSLLKTFIINLFYYSKLEYY